MPESEIQLNRSACEREHSKSSEEIICLAHRSVTVYHWPNTLCDQIYYNCIYYILFGNRINYYFIRIFYSEIAQRNRKSQKN